MSELRNPILSIILILSIVIGSSYLTRGHEWGDDFASYIMQAKSILNGDMQEFVEHNSITIEQSSSQVGPVAYPWGYPLILTPVYAIKGLNPLALKLPGLFFFAGFLICLYLLMRTRLTPTESLLLVSLFAFNPLLLKFLDQILSDIPFLCFSTLALLLITNEKKRSLLEAALLGGVIFIAFFIRATGILLLAAFLVAEFFNAWSNRTQLGSSKPRLWNSFLVGATFLILWAVYAFLFPGGGESYFAQYPLFRLETVRMLVNGYFQVFGLFFGETPLWKYLYYVLFVFFLIGLWTKRKKEAIFIIFLSLWMISLITWPYWQGPRLIFPLLPIFIYFTFEGMNTAIFKFPARYHRIGKGLSYGFWLLMAGIFVFNSGANAYINLQNGRTINGPFDPFSMEIYSYIRLKTPPNSVVVFFKPRAMRLMTDHDTIMSTECDRLPLGDYVVLSKKVGENQQIPPEGIGACNIPLEDVFENRRFVVYKILK